MMMHHRTTLMVHPDLWWEKTHDQKKAARKGVGGESGPMHVLGPSTNTCNEDVSLFLID